jgi:hypothetical protein
VAADNSLAQPERKQATATILGIYSTYSPRSSIPFSPHCSNFWSHSKKIHKVSPQPGLHGSNDVGQKMAIFQLVCQSREEVVVRRGQIQRIGWVIRTLKTR